MAYALIVLPAALTCFGRRLFWPFVPRVGQDDPTRTGLWAKVGTAVTGRPVAVGIAGVLVLVVLASPVLGLRVGLSETEQFRETPESVVGQQTLAAHFPAGLSQPHDRGGARRVRGRRPGRGRRRRRGAAGRARRPDRGHRRAVGGHHAEPASDEAFEVIEAVRAAAGDVDGATLVGGPDAEALDAADAADRDQRLIVPMILAVVLLVLLVLLRSVVAAVAAVLTVVATYFASLGASWVAFTRGSTSRRSTSASRC